jgi:hypothetical protein
MSNEVGFSCMNRGVYFAAPSGAIMPGPVEEKLLRVHVVARRQ